MRAPNISLFSRVIGPVEGSKHFIVFKGYRRTCIGLQTFHCFQGL